MAEAKIFWLGKGTIGEIRHGEEIPKDYIAPERLLDLERKGLIGGKVMATTETDSGKDLEIKALKAVAMSLDEKLSNATKNIDKLESALSKVSGERDKALKDAARSTAKKEVEKADDKKEVPVSEPDKGKAGPK